MVKFLYIWLVSIILVNIQQFWSNFQNFVQFTLILDNFNQFYSYFTHISINFILHDNIWINFAKCDKNLVKFDQKY